MYHDSSAHNGWGRDYDAFTITIGLIFFNITFWLHYNISCMADGGIDGVKKIPLDFSKSPKSVQLLRMEEIMKENNQQHGTKI